MKLLSMEGSKSPEICSPAPMEGNKYPYGLRLYLDNETVKKLGLDKLPAVGQKMKIEAMVEVCEVSMSETTHSEYKSVTLQITDMGVEKKGNAAKKLYGGDED